LGSRRPGMARRAADAVLIPAEAEAAVVRPGRFRELVRRERCATAVVVQEVCRSFAESPAEVGMKTSNASIFDGKMWKRGYYDADLG